MKLEILEAKTQAEKRRIRADFRNLITMKPDELKKWKDDRLNLSVSSSAGYAQIEDLIHVISKPPEDWNDYDFAVISKAVGMVKALLANPRGEPIIDKVASNPDYYSKRDVSLLNWGYKVPKGSSGTFGPREMQPPQREIPDVEKVRQQIAQANRQQRAQKRASKWEKLQGNQNTYSSFR